MYLKKQRQREKERASERESDSKTDSIPSPGSLPKYLQQPEWGQARARESVLTADRGSRDSLLSHRLLSLRCIGNRVNQKQGSQHWDQALWHEIQAGQVAAYSMASQCLPACLLLRAINNAVINIYKHI